MTDNFQQRESKSVEHYTPSWVIELAKKCLDGEIDLDPASSEKANSIIGAKKIYTKEIDGLNQSWEGNVFLNPPGQPSKWLKKALSQNLNKLFFIVYSIDRLPTILKLCYKQNIHPTIIIPHNRIEYLNSETLEPQDQPLHGSAFVYLGSPLNSEIISNDKFTVLKCVNSLEIAHTYVSAERD